MATRIYLPSSGAAPVTPSTWNFANQINPLTFAGVLTRISSAMTSKTEATGTTSPTARAMFRWVIGPLAAQTITGNLKGQMRGQENNAGANATLAIAVKIIKPDGTDRFVVLAQTASDSATAPHELVTSLTNSKFENVGEAASIPLTPQNATLGDYLVIEVGFRSATTTSRNITLSYGDNSATDLGENTTDTSAFNPWVEFSNTILFASSGTAAITKGGATFSGSATFTPPVYTASLAKTITGAQFTGSAQASLNFTGTAALTGPGADIAASGWTSGPHPVARLTRSAAALGTRLQGSFAGKPFSPPYSEGTAALTAGAAQIAASGWTSNPHPVGRLTRSAAALGARRAGNFAGKSLGTFTGSAALTAGPTAFAGTATFTVPVYTATAALLAGGADFAGTATFGIPQYTATAALLAGGADFLASATFIGPTRTATAALTTGAAAFAGAASVPVVATAALTLGGTTFSGTAIFSTGSVVVSSGAFTAGAASFAATGSTISLAGLLVNLRAYYRFEDNLFDSSVNRYDLGATIPAPIYGAGLITRGLYAGGGVFPGSTMGLSGAVADQPFTLNHWINQSTDVATPDQLGWVTNAGVAFVTSNLSGGATANWSFNVVGVGPIASGTFAAAAWTMMSATFDGTTLIVYINAVPVYMGTPDLTAGGNWASTGNFEAIADTSHQHDEVTVHNRALRPEEITLLYNGGLGVIVPTVNDNPKIVTGTWADFIVAGAWAAQR